MSARGISQTSSGEAATWEIPAQKCRVRTRKQPESRRGLDRSSIFSRKMEWEYLQSQEPARECSPRPKPWVAKRESSKPPGRSERNAAQVVAPGTQSFYNSQLPSFGETAAPHT
jgi:hypothetical protein